MILVSPLDWQTQATWENLFFTVPIIQLRMFGGYISAIVASMEAKTQGISICTLFLDFLSYENSFWYVMEIHFNLTSMKVCHFQLPFIKIRSNLEAYGDLNSLLQWGVKKTQGTKYKWISMNNFRFHFNSGHSSNLTWYKIG